MTEAAQINDTIRANFGPLGFFVRIETPTELGVPDWYYRLRGTAGWIEAKLIPRSGRPPPHFTLEQLMWGEKEVKHGGRWFLLGLREARGLAYRQWVMYDTIAARTWFEGKNNLPILTYSGKFPTGEIGRILIK